MKSIKKLLCICPLSLLVLSGCTAEPTMKNGAIITDLKDVKVGEEFVVAVVPDEGYCLESFSVDKESKEKEVVGQTYRMTKTSNNMKIKVSFKKNNHKEAKENLIKKVQKAKEAAKNGEMTSFSSDLYHYKVAMSSLEGFYYRNGSKYKSNEEGTYFVVDDIEELKNIRQTTKYVLHENKNYQFTRYNNNNNISYSIVYESLLNSHLNFEGEHTFDYCLNPLFYALEGTYGAKKCFISQEDNTFYYNLKFEHGEGKDKEKSNIQGTITFDDKDRITSMYFDFYIKGINNNKKSDVGVPVKEGDDEYNEKDLWNYTRAEYRYDEVIQEEPSKDKMPLVKDMINKPITK